MEPIDSFVGELEQEAAATTRLLERVPQDKLAWRPHPRSMTLGQLALHVATIPGSLADFGRRETTEAADLVEHPEPAASTDFPQTLRQSIGAAQAFLRQLDAAGLQATWTLAKSGRALLQLPRGVYVRALMLNHWYHHRGQLTVYLRLLDVPLPSVYGPSADTDPFA